MRRCSSVPFSAGLLSLLAIGCAVDQPEEEPVLEEKIAEDEQHIFGGTIDTTNDAVVYLYDENQGYACTGTIIAKNGSTGYVLTAAHCSGMDYVIQDDNLSCLNNNSCDAIYAINLQQAHPSYNGDPGDGYDFRMLRFSGATASTPVIPAATPADGLVAGQMVTHVGYGLTENGPTNARRAVTTPIDQVTSLLLYFSQTNGQGTCSGDSGGPALRNGLVVGVTSFGDQNCTQFGGSGRVAAVYNGFIAPFIGGEVQETCGTCFDAQVNQPAGACYSLVEACFNNTACSNLAECIFDCNTDACVQNCANTYPQGVDLYLAIFECAYCDACSSYCSEECQQITGGTTSSTGTSMNGAGGAGGGGGAGGANNEGGTANEGGGSGGDNADGEGDDDGCGCATVGDDQPRYAWAGLAVLGLALLGRRRRR